MEKFQTMSDLEIMNLAYIELTARLGSALKTEGKTKFQREWIGKYAAQEKELGKRIRETRFSSAVP